MIISVTGHRPDKLGGYSDKVFSKLVSLAEQVLDKYNPEKVLTGMALGWDQAVAQACINKNIDFIACVPFLGQEGNWPEESQIKYKQLLSRASEIIYVSDPGFSAEKMQIRNEYMVDHSDLLIALWNGSKGGTKNCIDYAKRVGKPGFNWWNKYK